MMALPRKSTSTPPPAYRCIKRLREGFLYSAFGNVIGLHIGHNTAECYDDEYKADGDHGRFDYTYHIGIVLHSRGNTKNWTMKPLDPLHTADMPEKRRSFWKLAGPGAVMVGLSIGAGEIIVWPRIVAEYGSSMIWAAVVGVLLQMVLNIEVGRWTVATGETVYTGFARVWRGFGVVLILCNVFMWIAPGWGRASGPRAEGFARGAGGIRIGYLLDGGYVCGCCPLCSSGPRAAYTSVERTIGILVIVATLGLIVVAVQVGSASTWVDLGSGMVNIGYKDPNMTVKGFYDRARICGGGRHRESFLFVLSARQTDRDGRPHSHHDESSTRSSREYARDGAMSMRTTKRTRDSLRNGFGTSSRIRPSSSGD